MRINQIKKGAGCHPRLICKSLDAYLKLHNLTTSTKRQRVIAALICASKLGCKVTRFDAEWFGDHCLNTTVSEIGRLDGIHISRNETKRPTRFGKQTDCKEYYLNESQLHKAESYLARIGGRA